MRDHEPQWRRRVFTDATLDPAAGRGGTVSEIEQVFDHIEGNKNASAGTRAQNRRLTLLQGGGRRGLSQSSGAPVSTTLIPVVDDGRRHDAPLKRYKPDPVGPALWSAQADWRDLTQRHAVDPLPGLPERWTSTWTVTCRHGEADVTTTVATVAEADLLAADPIRVNSWHKNKTARAGLRYIGATGRLHAHESLFERKVLGVLDFHGVTAVVSQPFTLTYHHGGREQNHTPDFLADIDGHVTVINTRPAHLVNDRLLQDAAAVGEVCLSRGWDHALVVGYPLPAFTTIDTVGAHTDSIDHLGYSDEVIDFLEHHGPAEFEQICQRFNAPVVARAVLQRLIWQREVSVDLNVPLEDFSLVALPGEEVRP